MSDTTTPKEFICTGRVFQEGKLYLALTPADKPHDPALLFDLKSHASWYEPGSVYLLKSEFTDGSWKVVLSFPGKCYVRQWESAADCAAWQARTKAHQTEYEVSKRHKKDSNQELLKLLLPLRREYQKTIGSARKLALELSILQALRTRAD